MDIGSVAIGNVFSINGEEFLKVRPLPQFPDNVTAVKLLTGELIVYPSSSILCRTPEDDAIDAIIIEKGEEDETAETVVNTNNVSVDGISNE